LLIRVQGFEESRVQAFLSPYHWNPGPLEPFDSLAFAPAGLHTNTTDIMAEMEGFGKSSQLIITSKMIEIFLLFLNGSRRADRQAIQTGTAVLY
jgi:hypothetical protein